VADQDGPNQPLEPEARLAARILADRGLEPPFDINELASEFADVEQAAVPGDCDAIVMGLHGERPRPLILLNEDRTGRRARFSLAHEIGHIAIPWHVGTIACHVDFEIAARTYYYRATEAEANRFAGELLLPSAWVQAQVAEQDDLRDQLQTLYSTGVSAPVACLRLIPALPPGVIVVLPDSDSRVQISAASPGTSLTPPGRGSHLDRRLFDPISSSHTSIRLGSRTTWWWRFDAEVDLVEAKDDRTTAEILDALLERHLPKSERAGAQRSIAGIIGYAVGVNPGARPEELHGILRERFVDRAQLQPLIEDKDFRLFLSRRAEELARRRR
jgi:hypothetical protein